MADDDWLASTQDSYDRVATPYTEMTRGAFDRLPFERSFLSLFAGLVTEAGGGRVLDVGCGPGWLTALLAGEGLDIGGMDLSQNMVDIARANHPDISFGPGSITSLPVDDHGLAGLVCWYVLHHVPDADLPSVLAEFARVLRPGGLLLIGGHSGDSSHMKTEGYGGIPMRVYVTRRTNAMLSASMRDAGMTIEAHIILGPDDDGPTGILFARRQGAADQHPPVL